ncbi:hypothetical protein D5018_15750 [Parashewanella curva]|uniref:Uncharacterized protein n=1 Tax=Parashewanella curva TaxID=2338552 RepID=A0A3L8PTN2_9GAMM|nr:hypothetical protein [Parashewanella curva]RLV58751.1 hypothetical protein D5018_15750 [Parashewanella curva]
MSSEISGATSTFPHYTKIGTDFLLHWQESDIRPQATFKDYLVKATLDENQQTEAILLPGEIGRDQKLFTTAMLNEQVANFFQHQQLIPVLFDNKGYIAELKQKVSADPKCNLDVKQVSLRFNEQDKNQRSALFAHLGSLVSNYSPCYSLDELEPQRISSLYIYGAGNAGEDCIAGNGGYYTGFQLADYLERKGLLAIEDLRVMSTNSADSYVPASFKPSDLEYARAPQQFSTREWFRSFSRKSFSGYLKQALTIKGYNKVRVTGYQCSILMDGDPRFLTSHTRSLMIDGQRRFMSREKLAVIQ